MINKALDLPFDEPQETYSTSEHLFHDQGIPPGTKGRIVDAAPVERKPREDRGGDRGSDRGRRDDKRAGDRPARNRDRNRTRTRGGSSAAGDGRCQAAVRPGRRRARRSAHQPQRRRTRSGGGAAPAATTSEA